MQKPVLPPSQKLTPPSVKDPPPDLTKTPGRHVRWLYQHARPLRPLMNHLELHQLANDRDADWLDAKCPEEREAIASKFSRELAGAIFWGTSALTVETALHSGIAKLLLMGIEAAKIAIAALAHQWETAIMIGVLVTVVWSRRRKK